MIRLFTATLGLWLLPAVSCLDFVNPPRFGREGDSSNNPIYPQGSTLDIQWTEGKEQVPLSVTLFQLNGTQYIPDFEYITQSVINKTSFPWLVGTNKNLTFSNMFYLSIFQEGSSKADANSHYFNISSKNTSPSTTTINTSADKLSPTQGSIPNIAATAAVTSTSPPPPPSSPPSGGLSTGTKIGIGIGIPVAMVLGVGVGFFLLRRHKGQDNNAQIVAVPQGGYSNNGYHNAGYGPVEVSGKSPVEMEQNYPGKMETAPEHHQYVPAQGKSAEPVRYELHNENS